MGEELQRGDREERRVVDRDDGTEDGRIDVDTAPLQDRLERLRVVRRLVGEVDQLGAGERGQPVVTPGPGTRGQERQAVAAPPLLAQVADRLERFPVDAVKITDDGQQRTGGLTWTRLSTASA